MIQLSDGFNLPKMHSYRTFGLRDQVISRIVFSVVNQQYARPAFRTHSPGCNKLTFPLTLARKAFGIMENRTVIVS